MFWGITASGLSSLGRSVRRRRIGYRCCRTEGGRATGGLRRQRPDLCQTWKERARRRRRVPGRHQRIDGAPNRGRAPGHRRRKGEPGAPLWSPRCRGRPVCPVRLFRSGARMRRGANHQGVRWTARRDDRPTIRRTLSAAAKPGRRGDPSCRREVEAAGGQDSAAGASQRRTSSGRRL